MCLESEDSKCTLASPCIYAALNFLPRLSVVLTCQYVNHCLVETGADRYSLLETLIFGDALGPCFCVSMSVSLVSEFYTTLGIKLPCMRLGPLQV